jgi:hypothetical protein
MTSETKQSSWASFLWYVISGMFVVIVGVVGAWGLERNSIDKELTRRVTALESKFERIDTKLDMIIEQQRQVYREGISRNK